jgi:hypothetical protein
LRSTIDCEGSASASCFAPVQTSEPVGADALALVRVPSMDGFADALPRTFASASCFAPVQTSEPDGADALALVRVPSMDGFADALGRTSWFSGD